MTRPLLSRLISISTATSLTTLAVADSNGLPPRAMMEQYCIDCHDADVQKGDLDLNSLLQDPTAQHADVWERVVKKLSTRQMPPAKKDRPDETGYETAVTTLVTALDHEAAAHPNPGRTDTLRRLNRIEYQNAIRDLLSVDIDAATLLPADEASHGFDNVTVGDLSPVLLDRYIGAAQKIARIAVGRVSDEPDVIAIRVPPDLTQEHHVPGLPLGTRGGILIPHAFPRTGEYEIQVRLQRDRNEVVEGLNRPHDMEILLDRAVKGEFSIKPPPGRKDFTQVDANLHARFSVTAGRHDLGVTFVQEGQPVLERLRQPYKASFNFHRHPRLSPAVYQVTITGPFNAQEPSPTPSREKVFVAYPEGHSQEEECARKILAHLMRRAYRRPVTDSDIDRVIPFFQKADGFESGIEEALSVILVSREFLFRTETDPPDLPSATPYRLDSRTLASRLAFFLWSSLPDDELLDADLLETEQLEIQVRRMLADPRASSLVTNFADQWLYLRNLDSITPDARLFPDFDQNLRQAFREETQRLFEEVIRQDRSVLTLIQSDHTWMNERLAAHYGVPHVYGSRFRPVATDAASERGGLLRQASLLTVTSYATRTSPVLRGHWILKNLIGSPPPPPPPDVPALDGIISESLPIRERLAQHRENATCASCHALMDPVGFALENYDAVGRWQDFIEGQPVDNLGGFADGSEFAGVTGLEEALLRRPDLFVGTLTEKLLTFALGRGMNPSDAPAVRAIVRRAEAHGWRFSEIIAGIATSIPFTMRSAP